MVKVTRVDAPSDTVDPEFYRIYYNDMAEQSDEQIKAHWFKHGQIEGRLPNEAAAMEKVRHHPALPEDFDIDGYLRENEDVVGSITYKFQAIEHYLRKGMSENRRYKPKPPEPTPEEKQAAVPKALIDTIVDTEFYRLQYPDMKLATDEKCQEHYFKHGRNEGRFHDFAAMFSAHPNRVDVPENFSVASYIATNPDLSANLKAPFQFVLHYLNSGLEERRNAKPESISPRFIREYYDITLPDEIKRKLAEDYGINLAYGYVRDILKLPIEQPVYMSGQELCAFHGIFSNKFLDIFDHEAYVFSNDTITNDLQPTNHSLCLEHFLTTGRSNAYDISYDHFFDEVFYFREYVANLPKFFNSLGLDAEQEEISKFRVELFNHWLTEGLGHEMMTNLIVFAKERFEFDLPQRIIGDLTDYKNLNPDLEEISQPSKLFIHYINHGLAEDRPGVVYGDETASFYADAAEWLMSKGKRNEAVHVYNRLLQASPNFPKAAHNLGDDLLRHMFHSDALRYYTALIDNKTAPQWSYINASACCDNLSDDARATQILIQGAKAFPDDVNLATRAQKAIDHYFPRLLKRARSSATSIGIPAAQEMVREGLEFFATDQFSTLRQKPIRHVTIVGNHDLPQCRFYRIDQKIEHLRKAGYQVTVYKHTENLDTYHARLEETDAVIFYRVPSLPKIIKAINAANILGLPTFYDMDDLLFDTSLFPPPLETYAGQITAEQHAAMATDVPLFSHAMSLCRFGIASTAALATQMEKFIWSGKVFHHKNAFGSLHERMAVSVPEKTEDDTITIFYGSGTKAHKDDFHTIIEPVFLRLHKTFGARVKFLVLGHLAMTDNLKLLGDTLQLHEPIWDTEDYWSLLRDRADINLSVLSSTPVTDAKSEIKWLEASMFGIPSVVSKTTTHDAVIEHGKTGFLCTSSDDFYQAIETLINDRQHRKVIGEQAREVALKDYSVSAMADNITSILSSLEHPAHQKPKTKIAIVNVFYPPHSVGGATRVVSDNVSDILREYDDKFEACVFTSRNGETPYEVMHYVHDGVRVSAVSTENTINLEQRIIDPQMAIAFRRFLDREQPDLVHFHCIQRLTTSIITEVRSRNIPYVITAHDGYWISDAQFLVDENDEIDLYDYHNDHSGNRTNPSERARAFRKDLIGARNILAVSDQFAEIYRSTGLDNTIAIENGVSDLPALSRTKSPSGRVRLAHIGGMSRHKGFHLVKHALMSRPDFKNIELLVVDHARQKGSIAREMWGSTPVTLIAKVAQDEVAQLFSQIDVLLAPSIWPESFGLVTREALMCGCRVIASDRGAVGACIDHGENGLIVPVESVDGVRDAIAEVDANPEFYLTPPEHKPQLRKSVQQARDLVALYTKLLDE